MGLSEDSYFIFHNPRIVRRRLSAGVEQALHARSENSKELESERKIRCFPRGVHLPEEKEGICKYFLLNPWHRLIIHTISSYSKLIEINRY